MSEKKGGGFLGSLKSVFVEDGPESKPADPPHQPIGFTPPTGPAAPTKIEWHAAPAPATYAPADPEMVAKLQKRLDSNCPAVYRAFHEQCENLRDVIPDEATRCRAAIKASHASTADILAALDQLAGVMDGARQEFMNLWEQNRQRNLADAEAGLKATDEQIASYEAQAKALQDTLATLRTKRATDAAAMATNSATIDTKRTSFESAWAQVASDLTTQKNRIAAMPKV